MATMQGLSPRLKAEVARIEKRVTKFIGTIGSEVQSELARKTPIDTGQAISNWTLSYDFPDNNQYPSYAIGNHGSTRGLVVSGTIQQGKQALRGSRTSVNRILYVTNNLDYIEELNKGSSKQAPPMFVESAIAKAIGTAIGKY